MYNNSMFQMFHIRIGFFLCFVPSHMRFSMRFSKLSTFSAVSIWRDCFLLLLFLFSRFPHLGHRIFRAYVQSYSAFGAVFRATFCLPFPWDGMENNICHMRYGSSIAFSALCDCAHKLAVGR